MSATHAMDFFTLPSHLRDDRSENSGQEQVLHGYVSLFGAVLTNDWECARKIFYEDPSTVTALLPETTPLHAAVAGGDSSIQFVKDLVDFIPPASLERPDKFGRTALHVAAMAGNEEAAKILVNKSRTLVYQRDKNRETPLHLAARHAHEKTVRYLLEVTDIGDPDGAIPGEAADMLLELLIIADFYGIALEVLRGLCQSPGFLSPSESRLLEKPLEILARRPEAFARRHHRHWLCLSAPHHCSCRAVLKYPEAIDLLTLLIRARAILNRSRPFATDILGPQLCSAVRFGNYQAVEEILAANPILLWYRNIDGHGFLELAVLNRQERVFNLLFQLKSLKYLKHYLLQTRDHEGNNILHLAARRQLSSAFSAALQVQQDLQWFKEIEKHVQPSFKNQVNSKRRTPREVFAEEHKSLLKEGDKWMKKTAESCTVVAALVVTVVFAAAFTVPGGNDNNGIPKYLTDTSFMTFAISDTLGLLSSTTSLLMFLSILSSRFSAEDLRNSRQYMSLSIGLVTLFFSIASMLVTFTASLQIVLGHRVEWIAVPIGMLASVPVILFAFLQFPLLVEIVYLTFRPIFRGRKLRSCFRCCSSSTVD